MLEELKDPRLLSIIADLYERFYQHAGKCENTGSWYSDRDSERYIKSIFNDNKFPDMFAADKEE